ncbi:MAG: DMT family transporter [Solirubrobacteraceae bacterium]
MPVTSATAILPSAHQGAGRGQAAVALAAVAWSTAGVLQRQLTVGVAAQLAGRALFAAVALGLFVAVSERHRVVVACRSIGRAGIGFAVCLAIASGAFMVALNYATVAQVLFIQAISPVLAALLARWLLGEPVSRRSAGAMGLAMVGVGVMLGAPGGGMLGDGLSVLMALAFALAVVIVRHRRDVSMTPATCLGQLMLLAVAAPVALLGSGAGPLNGANLIWLALLGAGQIGAGLVFLTIGARLIPAAQVALISLLEIVLGPLWVWLAVGERPGATTLIGGAIVVAAVFLQVGGRAGAAEPPAPAAVT